MSALVFTAAAHCDQILALGLKSVFADAAQSDVEEVVRGDLPSNKHTKLKKVPTRDAPLFLEEREFGCEEAPPKRRLVGEVLLEKAVLVEKKRLERRRAPKSRDKDTSRRLRHQSSTSCDDDCEEVGEPLGAVRAGCLAKVCVQNMLMSLPSHAMNLRNGELPAVVQTYMSEVLMPSLSKDFGMRSEREMRTLAMAMDLLLDGHLPEALDFLMCRFQALELSASQGWSQSVSEKDLQAPCAIVSGSVALRDRRHSCSANVAETPVASSSNSVSRPRRSTPPHGKRKIYRTLSEPRRLERRLEHRATTRVASVSSGGNASCLGSRFGGSHSAVNAKGEEYRGGSAQPRRPPIESIREPVRGRPHLRQDRSGSMHR